MTSSSKIPGDEGATTNPNRNAQSHGSDRRKCDVTAIIVASATEGTIARLKTIPGLRREKISYLLLVTSIN